MNRIVGAGLVGCLAAVMLAKQGYHVVVLEARQDPRSLDKNAARTRSINLAVSARGIAALKTVDNQLAQRVLSALVPMTGRMIHSPDGKQQRQPYGLTGREAINSIDRAELNASMLDEIDQNHGENVELWFGYKLVKADFDAGRLAVVKNKSSEETHLNNIDLTIGCDGAYSKVRELMMRVVRMDFKQSYIPHGYLELSIPPGPASETEAATFSLDPNHLHIWPRHDFMLIALPNLDKSFTCTLFAPFDTLDALKSDAEILEFFKTNFGDTLPLLGEKELLRCFAENPKSPLLSVQCSPLHYKDKAVLIGDSSHCMVPFYGQGMNCGFEDVRILQELFEKHPNNTRIALETYTKQREPALEAIQQLAQQNYEEMASKVVDPLFILRKRLDGILARVLGQDYWCPLYTMVTFRDDLSYDVVVKREARQKRILHQLTSSITVASIAGVSYAAWRYFMQHRR